jgi:topoisomerase-4 subunit A
MLESEGREAEEIREDAGSGEPGEEQTAHGTTPFRTRHISGMYENWFLDYASYVILERAVPEVLDGLKPVQRRILHAMKDLDDGRYNKVANIIGHTMQYHPHGDASIGDALVQMGQKDLLIDAQGNWGNILTGDSAAAPRYIEARLSKFALEVLFNEKTTQWKLSYDGRKKEPIVLPAKFPLLLAHGVEGIAVGLSSRILPHNFLELIDASIAILKDDEFELFPDFPTGGLADVSRYNDGERGSRVRVRARIRKLDNKTLVINEIPYGVTTSNLIESILLANDKKKIKIRKIDDNTASEVEILIHLQPGVSPDQTIDALYAFTACEAPLSPNGCVIMGGKPRFIGVKEVLRISTENTVNLLRLELEIRQRELLEQWHASSLERIFIEQKIYRKIENCLTWESVIETIEKGLQPFRKKLRRDITRDDVIRLTEIKIKRISKFDSMKADDELARIESEIDEVGNHLGHLVDYAVNYFHQIRKKFGKGKERRTEIRSFDVIEAASVAAASSKLYFNREEGFAGTSLKKDEFLCECSDIDDIIIIRADGSFVVRKVEPKFFVGKDAIHITVYKKNDERTIYNMVYRDGKKGAFYFKRFPVVGITRDKEYTLTRGADGSRIAYLSVNPNGEAEMVKVMLRPRPRMKKTSFEFDFSKVAIKGRSAQGNILTKLPIRQILKKEEGVSTLRARNIWFDNSVMRLNADGRGELLGAFEGDDRILVVYASGNYRLYNFDLSTHFEDDIIHISKFDPAVVITAVYIDGETMLHYLKRFPIEATDKTTPFLNDHKDSRLVMITCHPCPKAEIACLDKKGKPKDPEIIDAVEFIAVKSFRAKGKRLADQTLTGIRWLMEEKPEPTAGEEAPEPGKESVAEVIQNSKEESTEKKGDDSEDGQEQGPGQGNNEPGQENRGVQISIEFDD